MNFILSIKTENMKVNNWFNVASGEKKDMINFIIDEIFKSDIQHIWQYEVGYNTFKISNDFWIPIAGFNKGRIDAIL